ncbi:MAG: YqbH/XkdH family protein [Chloroflexi bacterium]|nr:YqbH/XkdH family protein [Chloroflexota bacterium]
MSIYSHFNHRAQIQRATVTQDPYGHDVRDALITIATVPCRLVAKQQAVIQQENSERAIITRYQLLVAPTVDIRQGDLVVVNGQTFEVSEILNRHRQARHHITCEVQKQ